MNGKIARKKVRKKGVKKRCEKKVWKKGADALLLLHRLSITAVLEPGANAVRRELAVRVPRRHLDDLAELYALLLRGRLAVVLVEVFQELLRALLEAEVVLRPLLVSFDPFFRPLLDHFFATVNLRSFKCERKINDDRIAIFWRCTQKCKLKSSSCNSNQSSSYISNQSSSWKFQSKLNSNHNQWRGWCASSGGQDVRRAERSPPTASNRGQCSWSARRLARRGRNSLSTKRKR